MPKKKTDEKVEKESENLNLDDYIDDIIDPDDYNFSEDKTLENLGEDRADSEDDDDFEDNDDDDENESEELKGWDAL